MGTHAEPPVISTLRPLREYGIVGLYQSCWGGCGVEEDRMAVSPKEDQLFTDTDLEAVFKEDVETVVPVLSSGVVWGM